MQTKNMPVFVKIDEYKDVLDTLNAIKNKINAAKSTLGEIENLKKEEDSEIESWRINLEEVEKRIEEIDKALFSQDIL